MLSTIRRLSLASRAVAGMTQRVALPGTDGWTWYSLMWFSVASCTVRAVMVTPDLVDLAGEYHEVHQLLIALDAIASERDGQVHLEYQVQKALGDRSPANTVGAMFDLSPANVRQIDRRLRRKLSDLHANDSAYTALARLSWVEAC